MYTEKEMYVILHNRYDYDEKTGKFYWKTGLTQDLFRTTKGYKYYKKCFEGEPCGWANHRMKVGKVQRSLDAMVWLYHHGELPKKTLFRRNKEKDDTRIENLCYRDDVKSIDPCKFNQEILRDIFLYIPETGHVYFKHRDIKYFKSYKEYVTYNAINEGKRADHITTINGSYKGRVISLGYSRVASRLIFMYMEGWMPKCVDHLNQDGTDNRWCNLRAADYSINGKNKGMNSRNTTGYTGLRWTGTKWQATFNCNYKTICVGYFDCPEEASEALAEERMKYGFTKHHGKKRN